MGTQTHLSLRGADTSNPEVALDPKHWIVAPPPTPHICSRIAARIPRLLTMKTVFVAFIFVVALFSLSDVGSAYSRFGGAKGPERSTFFSLNQQILAGQPLRFYGRFRNGNDDVLTRYLNRN
ncbi:hypothetical protein QR680_005364 [Steinernema hermaphroditum]|uniref:Uncharacterized protein n=1 Tax=Steinernema hermaphroditum TaxID=289476 RepID=A0AA39LVH7_9BILA|nr:hypothetical protein QR680_005364 [Steinernema hermaphroditum]